MKIDVVTIMPEMFGPVFSRSILGRAVKKGVVEITVHNLRNWAKGKRRTTDDRPFGGGAGMVMMVEPIDKAVRDLRRGSESKVILTDVRGERFDQVMAQNWAREKHLIFICGHYEGVDERVREHIADMTVSIGPFVMTGGEIAAMAMVDTIVRLLPGVFAKKDVTTNESFSLVKDGETALEYPQYTRPEKYGKWRVPRVLISGNHAEIDRWRKTEMRKASRAKAEPDRTR